MVLLPDRRAVIATPMAQRKKRIWPTERKDNLAGLQHAAGVFGYTARAMELVWSTSRPLTLTIGLLTLCAGLLPAGIAWVGKLIVDGVVTAADTGLLEDRNTVIFWIVIECILVAFMAALQRGLRVCNQLLRALLSHRVNVLILEKALELDLAHFEDAEFYDKLTRARREASSRPLSLITRTFGLMQNMITLLGYAGILLSFSLWAVLLLAAAAVPAFIVETRFAKSAFRLFSWRAPEKRQQTYLETLVAREDFVKEVALFALGRRFLERYVTIFDSLYKEDRNLTLRRGFWGFTLGLLSTAAFYGTYAWIAMAAISKTITLGAMTMYLMVFKQGQSAFSAILSAIGGLYEDNLYISNLYAYLDQPTAARSGQATEGPTPGDGIRFEHVGFTYPGSKEPALRDVNLVIKPGDKLALVGENGSGKTTLIKLLARLYEPTTGRITLDGLDTLEWDLSALRRRIGVIFQDFVRYQFTVGENIGAGDEPNFEDRAGWEDAAEKGLASEFIGELELGYDTQLGRWFKDGRELSLGQWQKVALARAFMRGSADIVVLDEPTSAMDAEAEFKIFEHFRATTEGQMAILISHRFSTVRMADQIAVLRDGVIVEHGTHEELMAAGKRYARLFELQAQGYR